MVKRNWQYYKIGIRHTSKSFRIGFNMPFSKLLIGFLVFILTLISDLIDFYFYMDKNYMLKVLINKQ